MLSTAAPKKATITKKRILIKFQIDSDVRKQT